MSPFDILAGLVLLVSALFGLARGATREVTTTAAFLLAALISLWGLKLTQPLLGHWLTVGWLAAAAALSISFIVAYILLRTIGGVLTRGVETAGLSGLDRLLGLAVGGLRGVAMIGVLALVIGAAGTLFPTPPWITGARLFPLANAAGGALRVLAPQGLALAKSAASAAASGPAAESPPPDATADAAAGDDSPRGDRRRSLEIVVEKPRGR